MSKHVSKPSYRTGPFELLEMEKCPHNLNLSSTKTTFKGKVFISSQTCNSLSLTEYLKSLDAVQY